jgi:hypothetical protein
MCEFLDEETVLHHSSKLRVLNRDTNEEHIV